MRSELPKIECAVVALIAVMVTGAVNAQDHTARRDQYFAMKRAFDALPAFAELQSRIVELELGEGNFDIASCQEISHYGLAPEDSMLANLAHDIVYIRTVCSDPGPTPRSGARR